MTTVRYSSGISPAARAWICSELGWYAIPLIPDTKRPAIKNWPGRATTDRDQLMTWFLHGRTPYEVGVMTGPESGIWVLDIDVKWCNGFTTLRDLFHRHGVRQVPRTFRVQTPSLGQHWYFQYPAGGRKIANDTSRPGHPGSLGAGLDVRGWHGQVVAPDAPGRPVLDESPPMETPDWLLELVTPRERDKPRMPVITNSGAAIRLMRSIANELAGVTQGGRNDQLNRAAFKVGLIAAQGVLGENEARDALYQACLQNRLIEDDGPDSFEATFTSGWSAGLISGGNA
ncbi:bifunctional DNA primase/polymerase [Plantactinospora sonchi]|uniref:Bifunctional DNA primase/polymerase n=1 Tax=Plantactinospora sonchi TaxID=1544735 RepID=A0ABU7RX58_9ACTN